MQPTTIHTSILYVGTNKASRRLTGYDNTSAYVYASTLDVFAANVIGARPNMNKPISGLPSPGSICFVPNINFFGLTPLSPDIALLMLLRLSLLDSSVILNYSTKLSI